MSSNEEARLVQEELFEILWNDTRARIRAESGIHELMVNKHLKDMQQRTFQHCFLLDESFQMDMNDMQARRQQIGAVLFNYVFLQREDVPASLIKSFTEYIEEEHENITQPTTTTITMHNNGSSEEFFREGRIGWLPYFPDFDNLTSDDGVSVLPNVVDDGVEKDPDYNLQPEWAQALTDAGDKYYWNTKTMDSTWDRPTLVGSNMNDT
jgi:hypothetical protein